MSAIEVNAISVTDELFPVYAHRNCFVDFVGVLLFPATLMVMGNFLVCFLPHTPFYQQGINMFVQYYSRVMMGKGCRTQMGTMWFCAEH